MRTKSAIATLLIALIIIGFSALTIVNLSTAQTSGTTVSGIITTDTTWTPANSPYTLTGNLLVDNAVTLTIQAGTTVNLGSYYIQINGTLQAIGNPANRIAFNDGQITFTQYSTDWNESTGIGCIISDSNISSTMINLANSAGISNNTIVNANVFAGPQRNRIVAPLICNNTFYNSNTGTNYGAGSGGTQIVIVNNSFVRGGIDIGQVAPSGEMSATIVNNTIVGAIVGVFLEHTGDQVVTGNLIMNCHTGIEMIQNDLANRPLIKNNTIANNTIGINFYNSIGNPIIQQNNIYNSSTNNILVSGNQPYSTDENAANNYWGTTDSTVIGQSIYDYNKDYNLGLVTFIPFLITPSTGAPTPIVASAGAYGSITPNGVVSTYSGDSQTFIIKPNTGYHIADVLVNGTSVGAVGTYTVQNVNGATTILATFTPNPTPTPQPTASPTPTTTPTNQPTSNPTTNPTANPTTSPTQNPTTNPTATPSSTPTVPELSAIVIIAVLAAILSGAVAIKRKNKPTKN